MQPVNYLYLSCNCSVQRGIGSFSDCRFWGFTDTVRIAGSWSFKLQKYKDSFGSIIFYHETNKLEVEVLSSIYDSKRIEIHWALDDLKVKVSSKSKTWFESSLQYSYPHSWTGNVDCSLFINYFGFKKINVYTDFSLRDKQKKLTVNLSYGSKVWLVF